jgi:type II secretory pathway component GspD/PulD (secretin)
MISTRSLPLASSLILLALASAGFAQQQPSTAINSQDEVVNVVKSVPEESNRLTIFRSGDKAEINEYVSHVIELMHSPGFEVLPHVMRAVRLEKGNARTLRYTDPETGNIRHFIQVVTTPTQMPSIIETVKAIDLPGMISSTGDLKFHYRLSHRRASEVAEALVNTTLSGDGAVSFDDTTNTIYFEDSQSDGLRNVEVIRFYDVPAPQVEFEVVVTEIDEDDSKKLGLDWDAWKSGIGGQFQLVGNRFEGGDAFGRLDALLTVDAGALAAFLNYTATTGTGRVTTRTIITASNDAPAVLSSLRRLSHQRLVTTYGAPSNLTEQAPGLSARGKESTDSPAGLRTITTVPPSRTGLQSVGAPGNAPGASALDPSLAVGEKSEGMYLALRPTIGRESVTADVRVVVNSLVGRGPGDEPIVAERLVATRVALRNEAPFALGGLAKETSVEVRRGIPLLKEIPGLRYLFSVNSNSNRVARVYIVITPRFSNQVLYSAQTLTSSRLDVTPGSAWNESLPAAPEWAPVPVD